MQKRQQSLILLSKLIHVDQKLILVRHKDSMRLHEEHGQNFDPVLDETLHQDYE